MFYGISIAVVGNNHEQTAALANYGSPSHYYSSRPGAAAAENPYDRFHPRRTATDTEVDAFRQGLYELGYVEGKNIIVDYRNMEGRTDRFSGVAAELVRLKVDIIVAAGGSAVILAVKPVTDAIPIVMANPGDPVAIGVVDSLARPGGNVTGLTSSSTELSAKRLELLTETVPTLSRVAILWSTAEAGNARNFKETAVAAHSLRLNLLSLPVQSSDDLDNALQSSTRERVGALIIIRSPSYTASGERIVGFAAKNRLPTMFPEKCLWKLVANVLRAKHRGEFSADRYLCGQDPQGREARRSSSGAAK